MMGYEDDAMAYAEAYAWRRDAIHGLQELRIWRMKGDDAVVMARKLTLLVFPRADFMMKNVPTALHMGLSNCPH